MFGGLDGGCDFMVEASECVFGTNIFFSSLDGEALSQITIIFHPLTWYSFHLGVIRIWWSCDKCRGKGRRRKRRGID